MPTGHQARLSDDSSWGALTLDESCLHAMRDGASDGAAACDTEYLQVRAPIIGCDEPGGSPYPITRVRHTLSCFSASTTTRSSPIATAVTNTSARSAGIRCCSMTEHDPYAASPTRSEEGALPRAGCFGHRERTWRRAMDYEEYAMLLRPLLPEGRCERCCAPQQIRHPAICVISATSCSRFPDADAADYAE